MASAAWHRLPACWPDASVDHEARALVYKSTPAYKLSSFRKTVSKTIAQLFIFAALQARCSAVGALAEALRSSESAGLILCTGP